MTSKVQRTTVIAAAALAAAALLLVSVGGFVGWALTRPGTIGGYPTYGGMMGGMMGRLRGQRPSADMTLSPDQALDQAQRYLDRYLPSIEAADEADRFYGYYTIHVLRDGQTYGMLSVNGYNGQVWYHNWHGEFVDMLEHHEG